MTLSRRYGLTFHLYFDPEGMLWFEVHRDRDGAILEFSKVDQVDLGLHEAIDLWMQHQLEEQFSHITVESCRCCGKPRQQPKYGPDGIDPRDELAYRFDLCPICADRFRLQNPWLEEDEEIEDCDEYGDW